MAVVSVNGNGFTGTLQGSVAIQQPRAEFAQATLKTLNSQVSLANGDSIASVYHLGWIPSDVMIDMDSNMQVQANAGLTTVSVGISGSGGQATAAGVANCLVTALNVAAGGKFSMTGNITAANVQQRAWQLAGLAADPGGYLEVYLTINAASSAATVITSGLRYYRNY